MDTWKKILVSPAASIREATRAIDSGAIQLALVVDDELRLLGTVSDGDIRRAIVKGVDLDSAVTRIMNDRPLVSSPSDRRDDVLSKMQQRRLHRIPVLDSAGKVVGLETFDELVKPPLRDNHVLLMAGGLGTRLQPLTHDTPKPMLMIGDRPILETILLDLVSCGFRRFYFSVNYKADVVKKHFGDGAKWGVDIRYLHEDEMLGTAGALTLLPERPGLPLIVMNGDLLTKINFGLLLDFHNTHGAKATMCIREFDLQVPYGVVTIDGHQLLAIEEKPIQSFFVNAGIYVLDPDVLDHIGSGARIDMPALFEKLVQQRVASAVFPIREYWLDIGQIDDLKRASVDFEKVFR